MALPKTNYLNTPMARVVDQPKVFDFASGAYYYSPFLAEYEFQVTDCTGTGSWTAVRSLDGDNWSAITMRDQNDVTVTAITAATKGQIIKVRGYGALKFVKTGGAVSDTLVITICAH